MKPVVNDRRRELVPQLEDARRGRAVVPLLPER
jgi:hypothetical protein